MHFTIPLFERRTPRTYQTVTLGLGPLTLTREGGTAHRVLRKLVESLQETFEKTPAVALARIEMARGLRIERVRLEMVIGAERHKVSGVFPVILEPRWATEEEKITLAYHPERQNEAIPIDEDAPLAGQVRALFQQAWADLDAVALEQLQSRGTERIKVIGFSCSPRSVLSDLPRKQGDAVEELSRSKRKRRALKVLPKLGVNLMTRAASGDLDGGVPRNPHRDQLAHLLGPARSQSVLVVGPPGCGKSTSIHRAVLDVLEADGFFTHRNLDRVRSVWQLSGRRLISGMSRLGEWEEQCIELLEDAEGRDLVLVVDDVHHFPRLGQSRQSARSLAEFFRGPLGRRQLTLVGECTPEELRMLEQEAPSFAALFTQIHLPEATRAESLRLMLREARALERRLPVSFGPHALRTILDVGGSLLTSRALPGKALDLLRDLGKAPGRVDEKTDLRLLGAPEVLKMLSAKTGVPEVLLQEETSLDPGAVEAQLTAQVIGQPEAVRVAADLVARVKAGMTDPRRPYGVFLFTGPTGTGKTELAKCLAELLYGSPSRLLRFDMSELSGPDAAARLIGDRWQPDGLLTRRVQEQPFSLILLDEIEKAHRSVHALLLQLFEDGRLTDAAGRTARFNHAVVVMTSNLGARSRGALGFGEVGAGVRSQVAGEERMKDIAAAVRAFFAPELFNRIDRVVPFHPLTPEVATAVTRKELGKLLRRRGLAERNLFVSVAAGVAEKLSEVAFSAEDGARSVKRAIEDQIGSLLSDAISGASQAAMQLLRVRVQGEEFALDREVLEEAPPARARWAIEPLLHAPPATLARELGALSVRMMELSESEALAQLSARIQHHLEAHRQGLGAGDVEDERTSEVVTHAEAVFNFDAMRAEVAAFGAEVEHYRKRIEGDAEAEHMLLEARRFGQQVHFDDHTGTRMRQMRIVRRSLLGRLERAPTRTEILEQLAEGFALQQVLRKVDAPGQHAVVIELLRAGTMDDRPRFSEGRRGGLLEALARAYADARGEVEGWAALQEGQRVSRGGGVAGLAEVLGGDAEVLVLGVVGLCVLDFFELESGTHVWTSLGRGPELVRVRVLPASPGVTPRSVLADHLARKAAFDEATRRGGELVESPSALGPVVRTFRFDPPERPGRNATFEVEDYVMGHADRMEVRSIEQGLEPLWLLRRTREEVSS
ncbi:AAA family ATPase [Chondromyces crocatus]|uniref:ATP-dependent Clp protease ATP-binding subunit n=1 Tax=Chondromyces crocatus TaxID=52 RepID=A0A0K1ESL2_CHOCO|nr:AAA family ATPase [Chondromyces crocatus]AKT43856.1 ATP-dependent Clp protease ATP-binding subunit [Chondromyces crocatus]